VTLTGPGGSVKTRLALHAAAESVDGFADGVLWVPLAAVSDPELVEPTIAQTIGAENGVATHIDEKRMLLLLDNLEQVLPDAASRLAELAAACPNLRLLLTSRAPLRIAGEREYAVEPLPEIDAVALFRERAFVAEPEAAVHEICRRLDGLPLAIELAAARTRVLPPDQLLARLTQALPVLTGGLRDAPERQRTLRATIGWSYELLCEEERILFARIAVFAASFALQTAEEVCDADLETLASLVEKSLVRRWTSGRLGMLETIKEYAVERLEESGEGEAIRRRHAEHFFALAESAGLAADSELPQRHDLVVPDQANLRSALRWALEADSLLGLGLAVALENFWVTNDPAEGVRWFEAFLAGAPDAPPVLRARALRCLGSALTFTGNHEDVERTFEQSLALFRETGDELGAAILVFRLGAAARNSGEIERARRLLEESAVTLRRLGHRNGELEALGVLGSVEWQEGNRERALELIEQSAAMAADTGFVWWRAGMLDDLARYSLELGRVEDALRWGRESLSLSRSMTDRTGTVWGLALHARIAAEQGDLERAGRLWGAVEAEEARAPLGSWGQYRDEYALPVLAHAGPKLNRRLAEGRSLSLNEAVEYALSAVD
jgi:predicted ATPase